MELLLALGDAHADREAVIGHMRAFLPTYEPFSLADSVDGPFAAGRREARRHYEATAGEEAAGAGAAPGAEEAAGLEEARGSKLPGDGRLAA